MPKGMKNMRKDTTGEPIIGASIVEKGNTTLLNCNVNQNHKSAIFRSNVSNKPRTIFVACKQSSVYLQSEILLRVWGVHYLHFTVYSYNNGMYKC